MKHKSFLIFIFGILFVINLFGYTAIQYFMNREPAIVVASEGSADYNATSSVGVTISHTKDWPDSNFRHGVQYDGVIVNDSDHQLTAWEIKVTLPDDCEVTDSWNIVYELDGNVMTCYPVDYNYIILPHFQQTFGFILREKEIEEITTYSATFHPQYEISDYPMFWVNLVFSFALGIIVIITVAVELRTMTLQSQNLRDKTIIIDTMKTFSNFIDTKDPYTRGHSTRVAFYSKELAKKLHLYDRDVELIYYIALLHDIGKILIPDDILNKPGKLTTEERQIIETHTTMGADILKDFTAIPGIMDGARYHHEHYDGSGYPSKLVGKDIPYLARIICVADSYDAMSSDRCYRPRLDNDTIISELTSNSGKQFDPEIVSAMLELIKETNFFTEVNAEA